MPAHVEHYEPGMRVRVTQQIGRQNNPVTTAVVGEIVSSEQAKTGSWYAHAKDDRLWLDRLTLRKDDGEIVVCNLDQFSVVEPIGGASAKSA